MAPVHRSRSPQEARPHRCRNSVKTSRTGSKSRPRTHTSHLSSGRKPEASWAAKQRAQLDNWKKPRAELLLMIAPHVERLVEAATRR
jgi:hypothetical protein